MHILSGSIRTSAVAILPALLLACANTGSPVVSTYQASYGCCGQFPAWLVPHSGVDFSGQFGQEVIAPADGVVASDLWANPQTCGNAVAIRHAEFDRFTIFCHFQEVSVRPGQKIKRGEKIGTLGDSGVAGDCRRAGRPCAIVHMELNTDGRGHPTALKGVTFDVLEHSVGCFDSGSSYPTDRLVLTYPVRCQGKPEKVAIETSSPYCLATTARLTSGGADEPMALHHH